jgi:demethylmenaquinone methyltransferase/2-methoxy-6-polyprenyl-1,4-benzoquinol methylase
MNKDGHRIAKKFFTHENASSYNNVVKYATFGFDNLWKREINKQIRIDDKCILDLACGTGIMGSLLLSTKFRMVIGSDLVFEYLVHAKKLGYSLLTNSIAEFLPYKSSTFDAVISSYLAKYADLKLMTDEHWRILKKGGIAIFHDFSYPDNKLIKSLWVGYFMILNGIGKIFTSWNNAFSELDTVIKESHWTYDLVSELEKQGFISIVTRYYTLGTAAIVYATKPLC